MEPLALLVLVGLASLGGMVVASVAAALALAIFFATLFMLVIVIIIFGMVGDYFYNKKMIRNRASYRLPWYLRWKGWQVGHDQDNRHDYKNSMFFDDRVNRLVGIFRRR